MPLKYSSRFPKSRVRPVELVAIVEVLPRLSEKVKAGILAIIKAGHGELGD